jgi:ribosomal protein S18 acetylase RimI-like enzyme
VAEREDRHPRAERIALGIVGASRIRFGAVAIAELVEVDGLLVAISNLPAPELNGAYVVREPTHPASAMEAAESVLSKRGMTFGVDLEAGRHPPVDVALRAAGLEMIVVRPAMAAPVRELVPAELPEGVTIRPIETSGDASALARVDAEAFEGNLEISERFYAAGVVDVEGCRGFVAWEGGIPVGAGIAYEVARTVGIYGVSVIPAARRRGIGAAITDVCARAFPDADLAWLQASEMGLGLYEGLGFRRVADWEVWVRIRGSPGEPPA